MTTHNVTLTVNELTDLLKLIEIREETHMVSSKIVSAKKKIVAVLKLATGDNQ